MNWEVLDNELMTGKLFYAKPIPSEETAEIGFFLPEDTDESGTIPQIRVYLQFGRLKLAPDTIEVLENTTIEDAKQYAEKRFCEIYPNIFSPTPEHRDACSNSFKVQSD